MKRRVTVIPVGTILESLFFRSTSAFGGYCFAMTNDLAYLLIPAFYLANNVWWVYQEYPDSDAEAATYIRKRMPSVQRMLEMDPASSPFVFRCIRLSAAICPLIPPFLYPILGFAVASPRCESIALITIIILLIGRVAEVISEVNSAQ